MKESFILVLCIGGLLSGCAGPRSLTLGVRDGRLTPCPDRPNCVSSQSPDAGNSVAPLLYTGEAGDAVADLTTIITEMKRTKVVDKTDTYLHVEFRSLLFRFVDDVEFLIVEAERVIHIRSASRLGYSDLGANRRRIEKIREAWEKRKASRT